MPEPKDGKAKAPYPPPPYTLFDAKERGEFLSEIGNVSPAQREIFHNLCKSWQPEISHGRFLGQITGLIKNAASELLNLMVRLEEKKCGVLTFRYSDGEAAPDRIILTSPGDCRYHFFLLRKELDGFCRNRGAEMPLEKTLTARGIVPPPSCVEEPAEKDYHRIFEDPGPGDTTLYRLPLPGGEALILPSGGGRLLIDHCRLKMRGFLEDPNLAAELARLNNTTLGDYKNRVESGDLAVWLDMLKSVRLLKADPLAARRVSASAEIMRLAEVLSGLIECRLTEQRLKKLGQEERIRDMDALALQMESEKEKFFPQERFDALLGALKEKYGEDFDSLRKDFLATYVDFSEQYKIPPVPRIAGGYLHRNNFYEYFLLRFFSFREALENDLVKDMEHLLRTNNRERKTLFTSRESFDTEIVERLRAMDPFLSELFDKPRLLTEAVVYRMKEKQKIKDPALITRELGKYFKPDTMAFRSMASILQFSIVDIFLRAFSRLSFFRQFWMRLTGKYESYRNQYLGRSLMPASGLSTPASSRRATGEKTISDAPRGRKPGHSRKGAPGPASRKKISKTRPANEKSYSKKQQESAWDEFSKTIRSKPRS